MFRPFLTAAAFIPCLIHSAAAEQGDWLVRLRGIVVAPTESVSDVLPAFPGGSLNVESTIVPELDLTYYLTDRISIEAIAAISPHDLNGTGTLEPIGEIADVLVLPPTVTLQYHFFPDSKVDPYIGAGINYTLFFDKDASDGLVNAVGPTSIDINDSIGAAVQAGVNFHLNERWSLNADIKYIRIDTTSTLNSGGLINTVDIELHPIVAGIGVGYRF
ncbi:MAG: OmpW family protein [Pseudomonadota bacterium]